MTPLSRTARAEVSSSTPLMSPGDGSPGRRLGRLGRRGALVGVPAALVLASSLVAPSASAQGFTANRYEPAEQGSDWFENDSLDLRGAFRPAFGLTAEYAKDNVDL